MSPMIWLCDRSNSCTIRLGEYIKCRGKVASHEINRAAASASLSQSCSCIARQAHPHM